MLHCTCWNLSVMDLTSIGLVQSSSCMHLIYGFRSFYVFNSIALLIRCYSLKQICCILKFVIYMTGIFLYLIRYTYIIMLVAVSAFVLSDRFCISDSRFFSYDKMTCLQDYIGFGRFENQLIVTTSSE